MINYLLLLFFSPFLMEDRIARVLTHYYGVQEILLPQRQINEEMPKQLLHFYKFLIKKMSADLGKQFSEEQISQVNDDTIFTQGVFVVIFFR